jgi:hypothetical protein
LIAVSQDINSDQPLANTPLALLHAFIRVEIGVGAEDIEVSTGLAMEDQGLDRDLLVYWQKARALRCGDS